MDSLEPSIPLSHIPDPELRALFTPEFSECVEGFDRFTIEILLGAMHRLGLADALAQGATIGELLARSGYSPRASVPLEWCLRKLAAEGFLDAEREAGASRYRSRGPLPPGDPDPWEARVLAISRRARPSFEIVRAVVEHLPALLRGEATGEEILFAPARLSLWFDYFSNDNLLYEINNRIGAEALRRALPATRPAVVVELGGGSGSAALAAMERLARSGELPRVERWVSTDIVPTFLRRAERALRSRFPQVGWEFRKVDMNADFPPQGIPEGSADVLYAVNTVHVARDLSHTLTQIRRTLKPGGTVVLSECLRPRPGQPIYVEFVFNFLQDFAGVRTDPVTRPDTGFLSPSHWRKAFRGAGLEGFDVSPDVEELAKHYPSFFVGTVSARRPAREG